MTESSEDKTKRRYIRQLLTYPWAYQTSLFYPSEQESLALIDDLSSIKAKLRRKYPDQPFLLRLALKHHPAPASETIAWLSVLTLSEIPTLKQFLRGPDNHRVLRRGIAPDKRLRSAISIHTQRPHRLKEFFGRDKVNRYALLNEKHLPEPDESLMLEFRQRAEVR